MSERDAERPRHVLVRSTWPFFDSTNRERANPSFEALLAAEPRPLLIDVRELKYCWFDCLLFGPSTAREEAEWDRYEGRWVLTGVPPKARIYMEVTGGRQWVRRTEACPWDGGRLDLERARCDPCGTFDVITWGPEGTTRGEVEAS